jgi:hypothetical protein
MLVMGKQSQKDSSSFFFLLVPGSRGRLLYCVVCAKVYNTARTWVERAWVGPAGLTQQVRVRVVELPPAGQWVKSLTAASPRGNCESEKLNL